MIYSIEGLLQSCEAGRAVVLCHGIGFELHLAPQHEERLAQHIGEHVSLWVAMRLADNEGAILYGFASIAERSLFLLLLKTSGVGARSALLLIGAFGASQLAHHIQTGDEATLCSVPSIGKRLAARLCLELKNRMNEFITQDAISLDEDAIAVLVQWGYSASQARKAVQEVSQGGASETSERITQALKKLSP